MKYFVQEKSGYNDSEDSHFNLTDAYIEFEHKIEHENIYVVVYVVFVDPNSILICACLENAFDNLLTSELEEYQVKILGDTHPLIASAIWNNANQQFGEGALVQFVDFDTGNLKWYYIKYIGNLYVKSLDDLVDNAHLGQNSFLVANQSLELINEIKTKEMNSLSSAGKGFWAGLTGNEGAYLPSLQVNVNYTPISQIFTS